MKGSRDIRVAALILGAGKGKRMGAATKTKPFFLLEDEPIIVHTLLRFERCSLIEEIVLVLSHDQIGYFEKNISNRYKFKKIAKVVEGGEKRQDSAWKGFDSIQATYDLVMIHDGVRPFVSDKILKEAILMTAQYGATVAAVPVTDTIKMISADREIAKTLNRNQLWAAQTPQTFRYSILKNAFQKAREDNFYGTDESSLVERTGVMVKIIEGSYDNIKITTPGDLDAGKAILSKESQKEGSL